MDIFSAGNLITLFIVAVILFLYRQFDRHNRSLEKVRKFADKLKDDLALYVGEREAGVRDYSLSLKVELDAAKELMNRVKAADLELADKVASIFQMEERLNNYDASLADLLHMTARVQENLNRIREESAFVETANKRVVEAKARLESMEKGLTELELRFERENSEALEKVAESVTSAVRSTVADLAAAAETIERQVEDHREAVNELERGRAEAMARDMGIINKTLKELMERVALRADKVEDAALKKLLEQAQKKVDDTKAALEEKIKGYRESVREQMAEMQNLVKGQKEDLKTGQAELKDLEARFREAEAGTGNAVSRMEQKFAKLLDEREQKLLEESDTKLEEYRAAQEGQWKRLASLADDTLRLDAELRRHMQDTENRVRKDFALFEQEAADTRNRTAADFESAVGVLKAGMDGLEKELTALKNRAYENVSEKLKGFEDDFFADLAERGEDIENRLTEWQSLLDTRLEALAKTGAEERQALEESLTEDMRKRLGDQQERVFAGLEQLKTETAAFEEGVRTQLKISDEALESFREQLDHSLKDAREAAEHSIKTELGRTELSAAETLKQHQRALDARLKELAADVEARNGELTALMESSRKDMDDVRRRTRELVSESDAHRQEIFARTEEEAKALDTAIKEADRHIKEFIAQTRLFEQADELKLELERRIEDLRSDIDRLDQRRAEASQLEGQFGKIRRLEDEVNTKMTRFLSEQHRIEKMEADFNRLLLTSRAVEEKLVQVSSSDDILQAVQVEIRRLNDAISETEDKYQRLEKKKQALDTATDGIDRNFKALQDSEKSLETINGELRGFAGELNALRSDIEKLAGENEKARETADKLATLDESLAAIEERIEAMQVARGWLAGVETRLGELYKEAQSTLKLSGGMLKKDRGKVPAVDRGAPPPGDRENIIKLAQQGWTSDEIASSLKISRGAVELVLETAPRE